MGFANLARATGETRGWASQSYPTRQGLRGKQKTQQSQRLLGFLELLTRFELVTRFTPKTLCVFGGPVPNNMGLRPKPPPHPRRQDEVTEKQKTTASKLLTVVSGAANQI